jgi:hypothetical protein
MLRRECAHLADDERKRGPESRHRGKPVLDMKSLPEEMTAEEYFRELKRLIAAVRIARAASETSNSTVRLPFVLVDLGAQNTIYRNVRR